MFGAGRWVWCGVELEPGAVSDNQQLTSDQGMEIAARPRMISCDALSSDAISERTLGSVMSNNKGTTTYMVEAPLLVLNLHLHVHQAASLQRKRMIACLSYFLLAPIGLDDFLYECISQIQ